MSINLKSRLELIEQASEECGIFLSVIQSRIPEKPKKGITPKNVINRDLQRYTIADHLLLAQHSLLYIRGMIKGTLSTTRPDIRRCLDSPT